MFGIGDQTLDTAKGLKAISSNVTIGIFNRFLNPFFVKLCKPSKIKNPREHGDTLWGISWFGKGIPEPSTLTIGEESKALSLSYNA